MQSKEYGMKPNYTAVLSNKKIVNKFSEFMTNTYGKVNLEINKLISKFGRGRKIALYPASHLIFSALMNLNWLKPI